MILIRDIKSAALLIVIDLTPDNLIWHVTYHITSLINVFRIIIYISVGLMRSELVNQPADCKLLKSHYLYHKPYKTTPHIVYG